MLKKELVVFFTALIAATTVQAAGYPSELHGKWGTSPEYCPLLEIDAKYAVNGSELTCQAVSVKATGNKYVIKEKCNGVAEFTANKTYVVTSDGLATTDGPVTMKYKRCGSASGAKVEPEVKSENAVMTCKVIEGAAGVTTFLDAKLKKRGHTIRDFDDYTFKADKKIKVADTYALVGKLLNMDGTVAEAKSYAYAGEWDCK